MNSMTPRQRMLTALDRGVPDRLPASVHDWMPYWLQKHAGGISASDAFTKTGLDWSMYRWAWLLEKDDLNGWDVERRELMPVDGNRVERISITTPEKILTQTWQWDNYLTHWTTEYLLKDPEDIFIFLRHYPREYADLDLERATLDRLGDRGITRGSRIGPWHELCELYGVEKMIFACFNDPTWVQDAMSGMTDRSLMAFDSLVESKIDLMETGGGHNSSTVISPDIFRSYILPFEKILHTRLTSELGVRSVYHTCGGMMPILDLLLEIGSSALETLTPPSMGGNVDLRTIKQRVDGKVSLIGGFDQFNGFENATPQQTREHVRQCFESAGTDGGYIMNPSDHFFEAPMENILAYADEASKCAY